MTPDQKKPLRIAMFCPYYPPHTGGLEAYAEELTRELVKENRVEKIVIFTAYLPSDAPTREKIGPKTIIIRYPAREIVANFPLPLSWTTAGQAAWQALEQERCNLVMSHTRFFLSSYLALRWAKQRGLPLVHIEHGSTEVRQGKLLVDLTARLYDATLGKAVLTGSYQNIAVSRAAAKFVRGFDRRIAPVIYRGLNQALIDWPVATRKSRGAVTIVFVGRLYESKGPRELLGALAKLDNYRCLIAGDGPARADLAELAQSLGLTNQVTFLGQVSHQEALRLISDCDIFVNPSYTEGLPTTVLEAAALGRAIVATDVGGTSEIVTAGRSAILVKPRDDSALAAALKKLTSNPKLRAELGQNAREQALATFQWSKSISQLMNLLSDAISPSN